MRIELPTVDKLLTVGSQQDNADGCSDRIGAWAVGLIGLSRGRRRAGGYGVGFIGQL